MPSRLEELQRQRRLIQEHLTWLDQEIAKEAGASPSPGETLPIAPQVSAKPVSIEVQPARAEPMGDEILARYHEDPQSLQGNVKRGCFTLFGVALALVALVVALAYILYPKAVPASRKEAPRLEKSAPLPQR
jgi:hypothetical protein